ncbi:MAG: DotI/IcmL family type IV secretion protein [Desulfovibrio sp.]|jgi:intracellular multiplication protein IcmL|nr:DotI/IcmL family type IV secretion protein [Desulfovibrio sp.]
MAVTGMPSGLAETVEHIHWYRDALKKSQKTTIALAASVTILLAIIGGLVLLRPGPVYFGMTAEMQLLPMHPLSEPLMNDAALKSWLAQAVTESFNMDFLHWRERLSSAREYFTKDAFTGFASTLESEGLLSILTQHRALMHAVPAGTPIITNSGTLGGVMTWELEMPILLNYETSAKRIASQRLLVTCRVRRVPTTERVRGIAISQLVTAPDTRR